MDLSDDDLIRMYCDGDPDAFDTLFDRYHGPVYNFARTILGRPQEAEEVLQETFMSVARSAQTYEPRGRFRAWLMRIVRNRCLNRIEAQRLREPFQSIEGLDALVTGSNGPAPSDQIEADEQAAAMRTAIAQLPDRQRQAIALYAFEQMTYAEIALVLDAMRLRI